MLVLPLYEPTDGCNRELCRRTLPKAHLSGFKGTIVLNLTASATLTQGMDTFRDFRAARDSCLRSARALTAPLMAGGLVVGFVTIHFEQVPTAHCLTSTLQELL